MNDKKTIWIAIIWLIIAFIGFVSLFLESYYSDDLLVKIQIGSLLYLALLSFGIFYYNNKEKIAKRLPSQCQIIVNYFGYLVFVLFAIVFVWIMSTYWIITHSIFLQMISATAVVIGLYCATKVFSQL